MKLIYVAIAIAIICIALLGFTAVCNMHPETHAYMACKLSQRHNPEPLWIQDERDNNTYAVCSVCFHKEPWHEFKEGTLINYVINKSVKVPVFMSINGAEYVDPYLSKLIQEDQKDRLQPTCIFMPIKEPGEVTPAKQIKR